MSTPLPPPSYIPCESTDVGVAAGAKAALSLVGIGSFLSDPINTQMLTAAQDNFTKLQQQWQSVDQQYEQQLSDINKTLVTTQIKLSTDQAEQTTTMLSYKVQTNTLLIIVLGIIVFMLVLFDIF